MSEKGHDAHAIVGASAIKQWIAKQPLFTPEQRAELEEIVAHFEKQRTGLAEEDAALFREITAAAELPVGSSERKIAFENIHGKIKKIEDENPDPLPSKPSWRPGDGF